VTELVSNREDIFRPPFLVVFLSLYPLSRSLAISKNVTTVASIHSELPVIFPAIVTDNFND
jgi:hypothetical protein